MRQIKVSVTAKREHVYKLRELKVDGIHINSRWIWDNRGERPVPHWLRENLDDIIMSDYMVLYVEAGDILKTSIGEVFTALDHGKQVFVATDRNINALVDKTGAVILPNRYLDPWVYFDGIKITGTLAQTFQYIRNLVDNRKEQIGRGVKQ